MHFNFLRDAPGNENLRTHVAYYMNNVKVGKIFVDSKLLPH